MNTATPVLDILDQEGILEFHAQAIPRDTVTFTAKTWKWCRCPYPGHPTGCPNFNRAPSCPPNVRYLGDTILDDYATFRLVWVTFHFDTFKALRRVQEPTWKDGMLGNRRHWQGAVKRRLYDHIRKRFRYDFILGSGSGFGKGIQSCESAGMDVFKTCELNGIAIDRVITTTIRFFALLCGTGKKRSVQHRLGKWRPVKADGEPAEVSYTPRRLL